jgi:hypothetical protein
MYQALQSDGTLTQKCIKLCHYGRFVLTSTWLITSSSCQLPLMHKIHFLVVLESSGGFPQIQSTTEIMETDISLQTDSPFFTGNTKQTTQALALVIERSLFRVQNKCRINLSPLLSFAD